MGGIDLTQVQCLSLPLLCSSFMNCYYPHAVKNFIRQCCFLPLNIQHILKNWRAEKHSKIFSQIFTVSIVSSSLLVCLSVSSSPSVRITSYSSSFRVSPCQQILLIFFHLWRSLFLEGIFPDIELWAGSVLLSKL